MKITNWEFRRDIVRGGWSYADGVWVVEFDKIPALGLTHGSASKLNAKEIRALRKGVSSPVSIRDYSFFSMELIPKTTLGLSEDARMTGLLTFDAAQAGPQTNLYFLRDQNDQVIVNRYDRPTWCQEFRTFFAEFSKEVEECEEFIDFLVSPARFYEAEQGRQLAHMEKLQRAIKEHEQNRKDALDRGKPFGCRTIV